MRFSKVQMKSLLPIDRARDFKGFPYVTRHAEERRDRPD